MRTVAIIILVSLVASLSGCTIAFGAAGGVSASSSNRAARERNQPETASVGGRVLVGAMLGLLVDALIINKAMEGCCPDFSNER